MSKQNDYLRVTYYSDPKLKGFFKDDYKKFMKYIMDRAMKDANRKARENKTAIPYTKTIKVGPNMVVPDFRKYVVSEVKLEDLKAAVETYKRGAEYTGLNRGSIAVNNAKDAIRRN